MHVIYQSPFRIRNSGFHTTVYLQRFLFSIQITCGPTIQVNEDLLKAGEAFSQWGAREVEVLASLTKCGSLLAWLATNIRDRSDLKTFYDLATIAAGESDHELDRVTHFYQVELLIPVFCWNTDQVGIGIVILRVEKKETLNDFVIKKN